MNSLWWETCISPSGGEGEEVAICDGPDGGRVTGPLMIMGICLFPCDGKCDTDSSEVVFGLLWECLRSTIVVVKL